MIKYYIYENKILKNIQYYKSVEDYQSFIKNKTEIQLKFCILKFYCIFHESIIQCLMKFAQVINLAVMMFSKECSMIIIPSSDKVNNFWKNEVFLRLYISN